MNQAARLRDAYREAYSMALDNFDTDLAAELRRQMESEVFRPKVVNGGKSLEPAKSEEV